MLDGSSVRPYEPRMRSLSIVLVLAACSDKLPDPPSASDFAAMTEGQQCEATAPRAMRCIDELMVAATRQLISDSQESNELATQLEKDFAREQLDSRERRAIHETNCHSMPAAGYQKAVVACWNEPDCKRFASCVYKPDR